jgi:hypothetical protein
MLDMGDNVGDAAPAIELFGVQPIGVREQVRRAIT